MTIPKRIDPELLDRFLKASQELEFPCLMEEGKTFVVKLGLVSEEEQDEDAWTAIEFPGMGYSGLIVINNREELGQIWMDLTTGLRDPDPEFQGILNDIFTETAATVTATVGKPSKRTRGKVPEIHWALPNGGRLVMYVGGKVNIRVESPWTITLDSVTW